MVDIFAHYLLDYGHSAIKVLQAYEIVVKFESYSDFISTMRMDDAINNSSLSFLFPVYDPFPIHCTLSHMKLFVGD